MTITVATMITLSRLLLAPFIFYYLVTVQSLQAIILFVIAGITDLLDGYVARRYNQQSRAGELLDPIADKALLLLSFIAMSFVVSDVIVKYGIYFLLFKEIIFLVVGSLLYYQHDFFIKPSKLSRLAGMLEMFFLLLLFLLSFNYFVWPLQFYRYLTYLVCLPSLLLLFRYVVYINHFFKSKL